jgi:hypothetical protein
MVTLTNPVSRSVRIKTRTGTKFTSYSRGKKHASTHWAGMTLILDALYGLGIINMIENNIPASLQSAKGIIDEYRNRWGVEVFFKEEKFFGRMQSSISMRMDLS